MLGAVNSVQAQSNSRSYYGSNGSHQGNSTTNNNNASSYNANGSYQDNSKK